MSVSFFLFTELTDPCDSFDCLPNGYCYSYYSDCAYCYCDYGWTGTHCETGMWKVLVVIQAGKKPQK